LQGPPLGSGAEAVNGEIKTEDRRKSEVEIEELLEMKPVDEASGRIPRQKQQDSATDQDDPADHRRHYRQHTSIQTWCASTMASLAAVPSILSTISAG